MLLIFWRIVSLCQYSCLNFCRKCLSLDTAERTAGLFWVDWPPSQKVPGGAQLCLVFFISYSSSKNQLESLNISRLRLMESMWLFWWVPLVIIHRNHWNDFYKNGESCLKSLVLIDVLKWWLDVKDEANLDNLVIYLEVNIWDPLLFITSRVEFCECFWNMSWFFW